jgi:hypothetical protein
LICPSVLYRHDCRLPFSEIQFDPAGADSAPGLKSGIAPDDAAPPPAALTPVAINSETATPKTRNRNNLCTAIPPPPRTL